MLGHHEPIKAGLFGQAGVFHEGLWVKLLVPAEVGEMRQDRASGPKGACGEGRSLGACPIVNVDRPVAVGLWQGHGDR